VSISKRLFKNTLALSIASAGQLVSSVILFFYLSRLLQPEGLGIYSTVLAVFSTVSLGCGLGFNSFLTRELPRDLSKTNRYLIHAGLVSATVGLILMIGLDLLVPHLGYLPQTQTGLYIISLALIAESLTIVLNAIFIAHQKAEFLAASGLMGILGRILVSLLFLYLGFGVISLIVIYTVFCFVMLLMNLLFLKRYILVPHWEFDRSFLVEMLRGHKVFAGLAVLGALFSQSEVLILSFTSGETQVGYYSAALKVVAIWSLVPNSYLIAMFPQLSTTFQESRPKATSLQNRSLKYLLAIALPLAVGMTVTAGVVIPLLYGPGFEESVGVLRLLAWYLPLIFVNNLLWRIVLVRGEQRIVFQLQFITEILQVVLALWLTPIYGCLGAAVAVLGGNLAYAALFVEHLWRAKAPVPLFQTGWKFALSSVVMGLFTMLCVRTLPLWVVILVSASVYFAMVIILRAISSEDITLLKQVLSRSQKTPNARREVVLIDTNKS
jgi:O-antigen/teichoic acid export membrane protein